MVQSIKNRKDKIQIIKGLMSGKIELQSITDYPKVIFLQIILAKGAPDIYYDQKGNKVTKEEYEAIVRLSKKKGMLVWEEVREY
jgi:hypothetical protein